MKNLNILKKILNNKNKLLNISNNKKNDGGNIKYLPPYFKE
jgi:hypothetical protein